MTEQVFLDANVFMYAAGAPHPYKAACVRILADVETGALPAAINVEVLQELLYRYSHLALMERGLQLCRDILKYPITILPVTETESVCIPRACSCSRQARASLSRVCRARLTLSRA
jgi:predicted nucleic acid-binding protein